jgi:hypothetical protein
MPHVIPDSFVTGVHLESCVTVAQRLVENTSLREHQLTMSQVNTSTRTLATQAATYDITGLRIMQWARWYRS